MKPNTRVLTGAGLTIAAIVGQAIGQPTVDGRRDPGEYGAPLAVQKSSVIDFEAAPRVRICAQSDQSNIGGKGEFATAGTQSAPDDSDPALVTRGVEIAIRLADLPGGGSGFPGNMIKIAGFISGGDYLSNQVIGGLDGDPGNLTSNVRNLNFETGHSGKQYIAVSTVTRSSTAPTIDGMKSGSEPYGPRAPQTNVGTEFGNNSVNPPAKNAANGSEIDGVYAYIWDNGTAANPNDDVLVFFMAGNLEPNFNRLNLFIDCAAGGQNTLRRDNSSQGFNALIRWGENSDGTNTQAPADIGPGLTFDADCSPDIWLSINHGNGGPASTNAAREGYCDSALLATGGGGAGTFFGPATIALAAGAPASGMVVGGVSADAVRFEIDNTNSAGAAAVAPNDGGVGGRVNLPGGGSQPDTTSPATVTTGVELKVDLLGAGWDGVSPVKVAGIIVGFNWDYMSNQAIGGLTMSGSDPGNLGFPAKDVDFNLWDGNQYVTVAVPGVIPAAPAGNAIDGKVNSSAGEQSAYGAALWTNTTNASAFGNSVGPANIDRSTGSELNAVYGYIALDPSNSNKPTLYVTATGNLHDFNKLILFFDTDPAEGQNDIRGDNAAVGNINGGLGGPDGFTFDTGFTADYAIAYEIGYNNDLMQAEHYVNALQLLTTGGGFGGLVGGGAKVGTGTPVCGEIIARVGFGNNDLTPLNENTFDRTVIANGSELDAVYMTVDVGGGTVYFFLAGNLEPNLTSVELFFDTVGASGQNTLIYSDKDSQDPLYNGNPNVDFGALNRMGGPVFDDMMVQLNPGMTFDAGFEPDYYFSFRMGDFVQLGVIPGDGAANIYGNWARLRTVSDPIGPMPTDASRYLGVAINDSLGSSPSFEAGDTFEPINAAAINNKNTGGVGGGNTHLCTDGTATDPATVNRGIELALDLADLNWDGVSPVKFQIFINGFGHGNVSNQILQFGCTNDLGEPRNVNFGAIPGVQYITWPTPTAAPGACTLVGDANGDGDVNFDDINSSIANWLANYAPGTGPGDANGDGIVNFDDVNTIIANWLASAGCN
jgi:hypothetical protein